MGLSCTGSMMAWQFTLSRVLKSSADIGYFPRIFRKVTRKDVPIAGMVVITLVQTVLVAISATPSLFGQFSVLVDLSVVTNIIPYVSCIAPLYLLVRLDHAKLRQPRLIVFNTTVALLYVFYVAPHDGRLHDEAGDACGLLRLDDLRGARCAQQRERAARRAHAALTLDENHRPRLRHRMVRHKTPFAEVPP